jgi:hypothetical protein
MLRMLLNWSVFCVNSVYWYYTKQNCHLFVRIINAQYDIIVLILIAMLITCSENAETYMEETEHRNLMMSSFTHSTIP